MHSNFKLFMSQQAEVVVARAIPRPSSSNALQSTTPSTDSVAASSSTNKIPSQSRPDMRVVGGYSYQSYHDRNARELSASVKLCKT